MSICKRVAALEKLVEYIPFCITEFTIAPTPRTLVNKFATITLVPSDIPNYRVWQFNASFSTSEPTNTGFSLLYTFRNQTGWNVSFEGVPTGVISYKGQLLDVSTYLTIVGNSNSQTLTVTIAPLPEPATPTPTQNNLDLFFLFEDILGLPAACTDLFFNGTQSYPSQTCTNNCTTLTWKYDYYDGSDKIYNNQRGQPYGVHTLSDIVAYDHTTPGAGPEGVCSNKKKDKDPNYQKKIFGFQWAKMPENVKVEVRNDTSVNFQTGQIVEEIGYLDPLLPFVYSNVAIDAGATYTFP